MSVAVARVLDEALGGDVVKAPTLGGSVPMHIWRGMEIYPALVAALRW